MNDPSFADAVNGLTPTQLALFAAVYCDADLRLDPSGRVIVRAPDGRMRPELVGALRNHRDAVADVLRGVSRVTL